MIGVSRRGTKGPLLLLLLVVVLSSCGGGLPPGVGQPATSGAGSFRPLAPFPAPGGGGFATFAPSGAGGVPTPPPPAGFGPPVDGGRAPVFFTRKAVVDPAADNVEALVFLAPAGWQVQGNVQWMFEWQRLAQLQTTLFDASTGITIDWLPIQDFIWFEAPAGLSAPIGGNYQGKAYVPPVTDPAQFVADFWMPTVLPHLRSATLVSSNQVPVIAEEFKRQFGGPADASAYLLRYEFEQDGQAWEQDVSFALLYSGSAGLTSWYVNFAYTVRAPKGELDRNQGTISTVVASRITTPGWEGIYRLVQGLFTQGIQQQMADTAAFGRTLAQHRAESAALQQQVTEERRASQDRIAELRQESLAGVETYVDPVNGSLVQLPVGWNDYWVNQRGEYLTSDQPGFDPNAIDSGGWQRLQRRP